MEHFTFTRTVEKNALRGFLKEGKKTYLGGKDNPLGMRSFRVVKGKGMILTKSSDLFGHVFLNPKDEIHVLYHNNCPVSYTITNNLLPKTHPQHETDRMFRGATNMSFYDA